MVAYESFQAEILKTSSVTPLVSGFLLVSEMVPLFWPIYLSWPWDAIPFFMREAPLKTAFAALQQLGGAHHFTQKGVNCPLRKELPWEEVQVSLLCLVTEKYNMKPGS